MMCNTRKDKQTLLEDMHHTYRQRHNLQKNTT
jgi:hypothetical protein